MVIAVRPAARHDRPALRQLFLQSRRRTFAWLPAGDCRLEDFDEQTRGESLLLAEDAQRNIAGFIAVWTPDRFIHHLHVAEDRQRQRIGRMLLAALPGWPVAPYRLKCLCLNVRALAFYRTCGFIEVGSGTVPEGDFVLLEAGGGG
ncbi:GNAT family N-acetyltransferase [Frateuria defendens]|uniref:GNAT family N-acetyltransferase n=1 Tax=Frateuria defendens TaxID=2219559 RepID=UPI00066FEBA2|nr:GNAT family N-acetyltransferase [Frateuria defendens]